MRARRSWSLKAAAKSCRLYLYIHSHFLLLIYTVLYPLLFLRIEITILLHTFGSLKISFTLRTVAGSPVFYIYKFSLVTRYLGEHRYLGEIVADLDARLSIDRSDFNHHIQCFTLVHPSAGCGPKIIG